jgi:hypothetical protein
MKKISRSPHSSIRYHGPDTGDYPLFDGASGGGYLGEAYPT